jgi:hypothetical protein
MALRRAAIWFRGYEALHRAKHTHEADIKADMNALRADELERIVDSYERSQEPLLPFPPVSDGVMVHYFATEADYHKWDGEGMIGG